MTAEEKQRGVLWRMGLGAVAAIVVLLAGSFWNPLALPEGAEVDIRVRVLALASLVLAVFLAISIGRMASHRFFTPADIDGGGMTAGTEQAKMLQSLLQNTLEQAILAFFAYVAWAVFMPQSTLMVIVFSALAFGVGRIQFFASYHRGAPYRGMGFALTFYPSLLMLGVVLVWLVLSLF
ncbi:hypothetical protein E1162_14045 [Rhodobacteraceae bacterium RKSG542]|nr:hypothetical protein [Pseudovibrio flavus]